MKKYKGFTMIETLITLIIVGIIIVVISTTLTALIKASAISAARSLSREESEFVLELMEKEIENSKADNINIYKFNSTLTAITDQENATIIHKAPYISPPPSGYPARLIPGSNDEGNEIHVRPVSSDDWICIGLYKYQDPETGEEIGSIVKNTIPSVSYADDSINTQDCMVNPASNPVFLTSEEMDVEEFNISHYDAGGDNVTFIIDLTLKPVHWIPGKQSRYEPKYVRQLIVSTEKLTL